ncbi:hypothetical protein AYO21_06243 [Fonsecaea monophora]|uniref:Uncharacterized protein n=1 Tax=Fonsecaea monophora TaxID=254056 RepID=A0A177F8B6_9EURO|nr:hypothetical protein AYO21_06243 [Fonsecaea monophora]KAH0844228.1 hypothetical protein FOPE_08631 [Fonsecaea pedrosoi]OAG39599.1 hypothetical protein AYO21_06243 [Fonsecaea monophora]
MALSSASQMKAINTGHCMPTATSCRPANVPSPGTSMIDLEMSISQGLQFGSEKNTKMDGQVHGSDCAPQPVLMSKPRVPTIQAPTIEYPKNHLLGIPLEVRDTIVGLVDATKQVVGARPSTGCATFQLVCRQTYHETYCYFNTETTVLASANRLEEFLGRSLNIATIRSKAYRSVRSLFLEVPHNSDRILFLQLAEVLKHSIRLEELHLFGIGADGCGENTSSSAHPCGKHNTLMMPAARKLSIDGQQYQCRLAMVNSIPWLERLRVLVLDNLNLPLLQSHVLKNKPHLETLYIAADPRTVLHGAYANKIAYTVGNLVFPPDGKAPPVKQLRVDSNSILTASQITLKTARTLESLEFVIPDMLFQSHTKGINFYREATIMFHNLHIFATQLRELKICVHGAISEHCHRHANFMGALKDCISRMRSLQLIELHVNVRSPWLAREFIEAVPRSVTRLYLTDLLVQRDLSEISDFIADKTKTPLSYSSDVEAHAIGEDLERTDYIEFSNHRLAFVGYEFEVLVKETAAKAQAEARAMDRFLNLNGRMLDKERNRHLAPLEGRDIPFKKGSIETTALTLTSQGEGATRTQAKVEKYRKVLDKCGLGDNEYFGNENAAQAIFEAEPAAKGGDYSYPVTVEVEEEFKFSNHWLSK